MEEKLSFKEFNSKAFNEFVNTDICSFVVQVIKRFRDWDRDTTKESQLVKKVLNDTEMYDRIAFAYATSDSHQTIQSAIGTIASAILKGNKDAKDVIDAHQVASELIVFASDMYPKFEYNMYESYSTINGFLKIKPIYTIDQQKEYYPLPNLEPSDKHRALGSYNWTITETTALDKLNQTAVTILDIEEKEPSKDLGEKWEKWMVRKQTRKDLVNKPIYFNWHPDYRGRVYDAGYHWHIQGDEYEKSVIAFAEPEWITDEGIEQIKMAIARAFGQDKLIDEDKLAWYEENKDTLNYNMAKESHIAYVQMLSLEYALTEGYTNIPVELDATCSQKQVVAALTKCKTTAEVCNIYNLTNKEIQDAYKAVGDEMSRLLEIDLKALNNIKD